MVSTRCTRRGDDLSISQGALVSVTGSRRFNADDIAGREALSTTSR